MSSMINTVISSKQKELIAAFEAHRKHFKVSRDTRMKLKMSFHIFRQRVLNLRKHLDNANDVYQTVSDEIYRFQDAHRNFLDAVSWDKLYGAIKKCAFEYPEDNPVERIKRSFLVELAADAPEIEDKDLESDAADDAQANEAQSDDVKAPKAYHEMHLHDSTKMLIEGYYNQVVSKIKESCKDSFFNQL